MVANVSECKKCRMALDDDEMKVWASDEQIIHANGFGSGVSAICPIMGIGIT